MIRAIIVAVAVCAIGNVLAQGNNNFLQYSCENPNIAPTGRIPKGSSLHFVQFAEESLNAPDPQATQEQEEAVLSLCNRTLKWPKGGTPCTKRNYYAARWFHNGTCANVYDTILPDVTVSGTTYTMKLRSDNSASFMTVKIMCSSQSRDSFSRDGNSDNFTYTLETSDDPICGRSSGGGGNGGNSNSNGEPTPGALPSLPPGWTPNPSGPPPLTTPTPSNINNGVNSPGSNNNEPAAASDSDDGDAIGIGTIVGVIVAVLVIAVLLFLVIDLKRQNSVLRRIIRGPEHAPTDEAQMSERERDAPTAVKTSST